MCLAYGPQPSDWQIKYRSAIFNDVEEFWRMVEGPLPIYDLRREIFELQTQRCRLENSSACPMPGRWTEQLQENQYEFCSVFDFLSKLSLEEYHELEKDIQGFVADDPDTYEFVRCDKDECIHCARFKEVAR